MKILGTTIRAATAAFVLASAGLLGGARPADAALFACSVSDVTLDLNGSSAGGTLNATACQELNVSNSGTSTYITALNSAFGSYGTFVYVDRTDDPSATLNGGIRLTLTGDVGDNQGDWRVAWVDTAPGIAPNLPAQIDLAVVFKAAETEVAYLFDNLVLQATPTQYSGEFEINWTTGRNGSNPDLSHIFGAGANLTQVAVPEPASLALLGMGLLGLGFARRRSRA